MSLKRCDNTMKSAELMRMGVIKKGYESSKIRISAILNLLLVKQKEQNLLLSDKEDKTLELLNCKVYLRLYNQRLATAQLEIERVESALEFVKATRTSKEYAMFYQYCFEDELQLKIANQYHYSVTTTSKIIREVAQLFLEYWDESHFYMNEAEEQLNQILGQSAKETFDP